MKFKHCPEFIGFEEQILWKFHCLKFVCLCEVRGDVHTPDNLAKVICVLIRLEALHLFVFIRSELAENIFRICSY
jgi:hypothetical protein